MSSSKKFIIVLLFFMDLRVHAEVASESCWGKILPCAVQGLNSQRRFQGQGLELALASDSLIERRGENSLHLVRGPLFIKTTTMQVTTPFADFSCLKNCKAIFERLENQVTLKSLGGRWQVQRRGDSRSYAVDAGLQVIVSEVNGLGVAEMEFPQSLPWLSTIKQWGRFTASTPKVFKSEVEDFRLSWREAVQSASQVHELEATRSIASYEQAQAEQRARIARQAKEEAKLKKLFREKNDL